MNLKISQTYLITHEILGTFIGKITKIDYPFHFAVIAGKKYLVTLDYQVIKVGYEVMMRTDLITQAIEQSVDE